MAVEIPVVIDIDKAFKDAASKVPGAMKPLQDSMANLQEDLRFWKEAMSGVSVNSKDFEVATAEVHKLEQALELLNYKVNEFTTNAGSVKRLSGDLAVIRAQFQDMGKSQMFESAGVLSDDAKKLQQDYAKVAAELERVQGILTAEYETQKKAREEAERRTKAAAEHRAALTMTANSMNDLNTKLAAWRQELNSADVGSIKWQNAAQQVAVLSQRLQEASVQLRRLGTESGSIDRLNIVVQELNREWNAMGHSEKFVAGTDKLTAKAEQLVRKYRAASGELEKQGKSLAQIIQEQKQIEQNIQKTANKRKYEELVLRSTANTMQRLSEQQRILTERLNNTKFGTKRYDELKLKLEEVRKKMQEVQGSTGAVTTAMKKQSLVLQNLTSIASMYFSVFGALRFIRNVRETTAEFEMQRVALAGIIQDANKAESLFKQIKAAAIRSPFEIKELVTYTKQLSAYRIETDKLFDVTTKLADVSAGLGVDMNRLVLAYGQVKSAAVLRGQELRQFTEAGIPLVDLLAKKFQELGREGTTTADVFELISKRAVPFEMVAEIFDDMTEKGGIFYKMQEKQAETLAGQWANLKDALSIMYDEIGNTASVHNAMEKLIADAKFLFNNWRVIGEILKSVALQYGVLRVTSLFIPTLTKNTELAAKATAAQAKANALATANEKRASVARSIAIAQLKAYSKQMNAAANATTLLGRGWHKMAASLLGGGWIGLVTTAVTILVGWLISARKEAERLGNELAKNISGGMAQAEQSVRNFERLANAAVMAANGTSEQRDALKELQRTYGDIIPSQDLQIEKLRELKGNYDSLTRAIREKIDVQIHEQNINQITDTYASTLAIQRKGLESFLRDEEGYSVEEATRIMAGVEKATKDGLLSIETDYFEAAKIIENIAKRETGRDPLAGFGQAFQTKSGFFNVKSYYQKLLEASEKFNASLDEEERRFAALSNSLGFYANKMKEIREETSKTPVGFTQEQAGTFEFNEARWKQAVARYKKELQNAFLGYRIDISDAFPTDDFIDFEKIFKNVSNEKGTGLLKGFVSEIQKDYLNLAPQEKSTRLITEKAKSLASEFGVAMSDIQGYLKEDGKSMEEYAKSVNDFITAQKNKVRELKWEQANYHEGVSNFVRPTDEDISKEQKELDFLESLAKFVAPFVTKKGGNGYTQDPFIKQMQDRMKFMKDFQKGYEDLQKYMSSSAAADKEAKIMLNRGLSMGIDPAEQRRAAEDLSKWYKDTMDSTFEYLKKEKGVTGTLNEFLSRQITGNKDRDKMLRDFQSMLQSMFDAKTDFDTSKLTKDIDDALKRVTDEIKRSETARNFYNNILDMTGDEELSASMAVSVYGGIGEDFKDRIQRQLVGALNSLDPESLSGLSDKIKNAFSAGDYDYLVKHLAEVPEKLRDTVKQVAGDAEKYNEGIVSNLLKTLQKAKTYGDKQADIAKQSAKRIAEINSLSYSDAMKNSLLSQNTKKVAEETARAQYEAFKDSPLYIELFENLEGASTRMLRNMRDNLLALKDQWKNLSPRELKELQSKLDDLDKQLAMRNPFGAMIASLKEYRRLTKERSQKDVDMDAATATEFANTQKALLEDAKKRYEAVKGSATATAEEVSDAKVNLDLQASVTDEAIEQAEKAQETASAYRRAAKHIQDAASGLSEWTGYVKESLQGIGDIVDTFASKDVSDTFNILSSGLEKTLGGAATTASSIARLMAGDFTAIPALISGIGSLVSGIFGTATELKLKKLDKEIENQQRLLDDLEDSYSRLADLEDKVFGSEFIHNYTQRLATLRAEIEAYKAQAKAEEDKGKKSDKDKIRDYEKAARDAALKIEDMQSEVSEKFFGADLSSAARDFASAWVDAYKEFGSTTDAISERFRDMIQNMIVESMAAQIVEKQLKGVFDTIDELSKDGQFSISDAATVADMAQQSISSINIGLSNLMSALNGAGLGVRTMGTGLTGISKSIATASEESILGLAAGINTQNFYMQQIHLSVLQIKDILTAGAAADGKPTAITTENIPYYRSETFQTHMTEMHDDIRSLANAVKSVITPKTASVNTHVVAVK